MCGIVGLDMLLEIGDGDSGARLRCAGVGVHVAGMMMRVC